ncbi:MAG: chromosomal replication initiator protein DnaA [Clostridia bacterium]|nr:chromosomal replication initiator protein DnaA [Clostridia bacterium]
MSDTPRQFVPEEIMKAIVAQARSEHSEAFVELWFGRLKLFAVSEAIAIFICESSYRREILNSNHKQLLKKYASAAVGFDIEVEIFSQENINIPDAEPEDGRNSADGSDPAFFGEIPDEQMDTPDIEGAGTGGTAAGDHYPGLDLISDTFDGEGDPGKETRADENTAEPEETGTPDDTEKRQTYSHTKINNAFTFDNFIVGSSNKFAYAACYAVANNPSNEYNPLFIYGNSGLGKTHLLYAATNLMLENDPDIRILFVKGEDFTNEMIKSIQTGRNVEFRNKYRKCDVLLVDDIQFIGGKEGTQEEFFHTFNALYEDGRQIIMTSDRPPKEIKTLSDRLRGRFEGGLIADIQPPNLELRVAILKDKSDKMGLEVPIDILTAIASLLKDNVRQLEGAIKRLGAQHMLTGKPFTIETAMDCISDMISGDPIPKVTPEKILEAVAEKYGVTVQDIKSRKRTQKIASARHIAVYIIRKLTNLEFTKIGEILGRDHSTILNSYYTVDKEIKINSLYELDISNLMNSITKTE